jgi:hypothetical protein
VHGIFHGSKITLCINLLFCNGFWSVGNEVFYNNLIFDKIMPLMVNSSLMAFFGRLNASDAEN